MTRLIKQLKLEDKVIMTGAMDQQFIRDTLQQADIFLMTSTHDEEGRRETQGVVTGEAQACGLPVVAFNGGGIPYTMIDGKTGFLSEEKDYISMADHVEKLILDPVLRKKMSANARQFVVEHYSLESSAAKMQKIYQKLIA
jgi:colanic acid/amylovoran biosynthesis glycosyltransferase